MLSGKGLRMLVCINIPEEAIGCMQELAPGLHIDILGSKDTGYLDALSQADIIVGWPKVNDLTHAKKLRWLQIASAGANRYIASLPEHVILTNASGVFGIPIAEHLFAMILAMTRGIPAAVRAAEQQCWERTAPFQELYRATCGIVGFGDIGTEMAKRAKAFGMRVLAVKRTACSKPAFVDELWDVTGLDRLFTEADHIVITLPGTTHTKGLVGDRLLSLIKQGSYIYNIGRGSVIDETALLEHLQSGRIAGAGLDVFSEEPLPSDSPLWRMPNVIITPHCAGSTVHHGERLAAIVLRNLPRFLVGEPLENTVDRFWQY